MHPVPVCVFALPVHDLCSYMFPDVCVCVQFKWLEQTLLLIFTSLFFVGRILMAPAKYIPTYQYHHRMEPQAGAHTLLVIISLVFMLQVYWFSLLLTRISNMVRPSARAKAQHMVAVVLQRSPSGVH